MIFYIKQQNKHHWKAFDLEKHTIHRLKEHDIIISPLQRVPFV